jgi:hypothetical protein
MAMVDRGSRLHPFKRLLLLAVAALAVSAVLLAAVAHFASAGSPSRAQAHSTPTENPTPTRVPTVLYTADWSHGPDGWHLPTSWRIQSGRLIVDGEHASVSIPYEVTASRYVIEMEINVQAVHTGPPHPHLGHFGIIALDTTGRELYTALTYCKRPIASCVGFAEVVAPGTLYHPGAGSPVAAADFASGGGSQTYRMVVEESMVEFCPLDDCIGTASSDLALAPARLNLDASDVRLTVTRFIITTA